ncbi:hypothetical protein [Erwinia sorbitola]|uniref:Uncharacterized protein n=1 Tax=Erwinia sorbitola TaxID=2681984 RepID=A0A6I6EKA6_9GAMM|nr:hypothetical protein [Erwinia sorbitola]QGU87041.1 hypothetical protein GN242_07340 [Erwinia sorbitola]
MKLIDILVNELPKRGGWPEGVDEIWQDYDRLMRPGVWGWFHDELSEDHRPQHHDAEVKVNRKQYEAALAAQQSSWNGEGLPPVGAMCERSWCGGNWLSCEILFIGVETVAVRLSTREVSYGLSEVEFRPIRTEAERRREDAIAEMASTPKPCGYAIYDICAQLYDAGYRKGEVSDD